MKSSAASVKRPMKDLAPSVNTTRTFVVKNAVANTKPVLISTNPKKTSQSSTTMSAAGVVPRLVKCTQCSAEAIFPKKQPRLCADHAKCIKCQVRRRLPNKTVCRPCLIKCEDCGQHATFPSKLPMVCDKHSKCLHCGIHPRHIRIRIPGKKSTILCKECKMSSPLLCATCERHPVLQGSTYCSLHIKCILCGKQPRDVVGLACLDKLCLDRWYGFLPSKRDQMEIDFAAGTLKATEFKVPKRRKCIICDEKAEYPNQQPNYCKRHRLCVFCLEKDRRPMLQGASEMDLCCDKATCIAKFSKMSATERDNEHSMVEPIVTTKKKKAKRKRDEDPDLSGEPIDLSKRPTPQVDVKKDVHTPQRIIAKFTTLLKTVPFNVDALDRMQQDLNEKLKSHPLYTEELHDEIYAKHFKIRTEEEARAKKPFRHIVIRWYVFRAMMECLAKGSNWMDLEWLPTEQVVHSSVFSGSTSSSSSSELSSSELSLELDSSSSSTSRLGSG
jgi:hypothetical protein